MKTILEKWTKHLYIKTEEIVAFTIAAEKDEYEDREFFYIVKIYLKNGQKIKIICNETEVQEIIDKLKEKDDRY